MTEPGNDPTSTEHLINRRNLLAGTGATVVGLSGCLGNSNDTPSGTTDDSDDDNGDSTDQGDSSGDSNQDVTVSWTAWDDRDAFKEMVKKFSEEHDSITAEFVHTPGDPHREYHKAMLTKIGSGNVPDLMNLLIPDSVSLFSKEGKLTELSGYIEDSDDFSLDMYYDFVPDMIRMPHDNGIYSLPQGVSSMAMYYNEEMYENAGIDAPPETWDELRTTLETLKDNGHELPFYNSFVNGVTKMFWQFMFQKGGNVTNEDNSKSIINSQENLEALQFIDGLVKDGLVVNSNESEPDYSTEAIGDEYAAHIIGGPWNWRHVKFTAEILDKINLAPLPVPSDGEQACVTNTNSIAMAGVSEHKDAAWELQKFLAAGEGMDIQYKSGNTLSPLTKDKDAKFYQDRPKLAVHMEMLPHGHQLMWGTKTPEIMTEYIVPQLQAVYLGDKTPKEGLDTAHEKINSAL